MSKYIELISLIKPKNNLSFPIADTLDLIGGYVLVNNINERNSIDSAKLRKGMLCYVSDEDTIYKYSDTSWEEFKISDNIYNLDYPGLESSDNKSFTEEEYNSLLNSPIITINNKYIVYSKKFNTTTELLELGIYISAQEILIISIDSGYDAQVNSYSILNNGDIVNITGSSTSITMSQHAITKELNKKLNAFYIGKGLALSENGTLYCTLDNLIFQVVEELPKDGSPNKIYLVNNHSSELKNVYSEYMWVNGLWELVGTHNSELNLEDYVTKSDLLEAFEDFCWEVDLYDSELNIKNKNTGESLSISDEIYNTKDFYIVFDAQFYQFIMKVMCSKGIISQGNINLLTVAMYLGHNWGIIGIDGITGKFIELRFEYTEDIESDYDVYYVYFTDYDYLTSKDLASVNRLLDTLNFKVNNLPIVPIQKTYYEITEVGLLEGISEGSVVYFQQYLEEENVTYGSFQWIDDVSEFVCYTETSNDASTIYSDPNMTHPIYSGQEYKKEIVRDGQTPILYIRTTNDIQIHRCAYNGLYVGPVLYYPGFYIKTSTDLLKLASQVDLPTKVSELDNDAKFTTAEEVNMAILNAIIVTLNTEV